MNLKELQNWVKRFARSSPSPGDNQTHRSAEQTRDDRTNSVVELRKDVRALQQEISDLVDAQERGGLATRNVSPEAQMASLQRRLAEKQSQLAKFQARV
jgi:hypothetical protein